MLLRDGRSAYSSWVRVTNESTDLSLISISPNPGAGAIRLTINAPNSLQARLLVYDQLGQLVSKQTFSIVKGTRDYPAQYLSQPPAGAYRLVLRDDIGKMPAILAGSNNDQKEVLIYGRCGKLKSLKYLATLSIGITWSA